MCNQPYALVARAIADKFKRSVSERAISRYIKDAQINANMRPEGPQLAVLRRGRPPKSAEDKKGKPLQHQQAMVKTDANRKPEHSFNWNALWLELLALTRATPSKLYSVLSSNEMSQIKLKSRASFFRDLRKDGNLPPRHTGLVQEKKSNAHPLRIHQLMFTGPESSIRVILIGYDSNSHFVNAAVFHIDVELGTVEAKPRRGRKPVRAHKTWQASLSRLRDGTIHAKLPVQAILHFAQMTRAQMGVPVGWLFLNQSLGLSEGDGTWLEMQKPQWRICMDTWVTSQYLPAELFQDKTDQELRHLLVSNLNPHNKKQAEPILRIKRAEKKVVAYEREPDIPVVHRHGRPMLCPITRLKGIHQAVGVNLTTTLPPKTD